MAGYVIACPVFTVVSRIGAFQVGYCNKHCAIFGQVALQVFECLVKLSDMFKYVPKSDSIESSRYGVEIRFDLSGSSVAGNVGCG